MATNMPGGLDTFANPAATDLLTGHAAKHDNIQDAMVAVQRIVVGPTHKNVIGDYGADPNGSVDSTTAINNALASKHIVHFPPGGYKTTSTLFPQPNTHVSGVWGGYVGMNPALFNGSIIKWAGPTNTPMVSFNNVQHVKWDGVGLDGGTISGAEGFRIDSNNTPRSSDITLDNLWLARMGNPVAGTAGWGVRIAPSGTGTQYQNDRVKIGGGWIEACDVAIQISSSNACDCTTIGGDQALTIDNYNRGIVIDACGQMTIDSVTWGAMARVPQRTVASCVTTAGSKTVTVPDGSLIDLDVGASFKHPNVPTFYIIAKVLSSTSAELNRAAGITSGTASATITRGGYGIVLTNFWNNLTIRNCQSESAAYGGAGTAPGFGLRILPTAGGGMPPITMQGNIWGVSNLLSQQSTIVSIGETFAFDYMLDKDYASVFALGHQWMANATYTPNFQKTSTGVYSMGVQAMPIVGTTAGGPFQILAGAPDGLLTLGTTSGNGLTLGQAGQYPTFGGKTGVRSVPMAAIATPTSDTVGTKVAIDALRQVLIDLGITS